jgi:amino acid adenylation domain-containing protein/thioester reductase-like protein
MGTRRLDPPAESLDPAAARQELLRRRLAGRRSVRRPTIEHADRAGRLPLSFGQERLWFLSMLSPDSAEYQVPVVLRLRGALDVAALAAAYRRVLDRHEILRTRYRLRDARPIQVIDPPGPVELQVTEASGDEALELARREVATPFDLGLEHPIRARLVRIADDEHLLVLVLHHVAADGPSLEILLRDLFAYYGGDAPAALPVQYADYAVWQRNRLHGDRLEDHLAYWRAQLAGLAALELPTDRPRGAVRDWRGDRVRFSVPAELAQRLRELARAHGTTLFVVALTAYQVLLARLSGQRDLAVGSAITGRGRPELRDLVGFFLDTVVLRTRLDGDPTLLELLDHNRVAVLEALGHQEAPVQLLVDELDRNRDLSRTPLFQVMFDLVQAPPPGLRVGDLDVEPLDVVGAIAKHDLRLELAEEADGSLRGTLEYPTALFDASTVGTYAALYRRLLEELVSGARVSAVALVDPEEEQRLVEAGTGARFRLPRRTVSEVVARWAGRYPETTAVVTAEGALSFADLDAAANRFAHALRDYGIGPESVVAVCLERGPDLLPALLGVWRACGAYLPLDPGDPPQRLTELLRDAGAAVLITDSTVADRLPDDGRLSLLVDEDRGLLDAQPSGNPGDCPELDSLAYLIYTSGSTGRPKGVQVSHRALLNYLWWAVETYVTPDSGGAPVFSSIAFDLAVTSLYVPLLAGQPVHLLPPGLDAAELGEQLAQSYSFVKLTPGHLELLTQQLSPERAAGLARHLVVGGEAFPSRLAARWRELAGPSGAVLVNEYGPTEITVANVIYQDVGPLSQAVLPIGQPMPNTVALVLDENLRPVPAGLVGELYLGGCQLARGYHDQPDITAQRFVANPYGPPGSRLYRSGDLARMRLDGNLEFVGRADEQLKIRGYRVEPTEVVAALRRHPLVADAAVVLRESGTAGRALVAYLVPAHGALPEPEELRAFLEPVLPSYLVPSAFVEVPAIPLTPNGKLDRRALPDPARGAPAAGQGPSSELERRLADLWAGVLGLGEVGRHDDFFDVGGDSVSAVAVVGALRDEGLDVTVQDVFEHSTVAGLAAALGDRPALAQPVTRVRPWQLIPERDRARIPAGIVDAYPLSSLQSGMLYEMLSGGGTHYYHNATTYVIRDDRPFSLPALREAARLLVERNEMLRTSFDMTSFSVPLQLVHEAAELPVGSQDLRHLGPHERDAEVRRYMAEQRRTLFDLGTPPLFRLFAHVLTDDRWQLTITECHPILEGWGYHLLLMDLITWYRLIRDGQPVPPEQPRPVRYADFIAAERASIASLADRGYWKRTIETVPRLELPAAWADPGADPGESGAQYLLEVMFVDLADGLRALAKDADVPFKSVLHAAHLKVLSMITPQPRFFGGLVCDTRPEIAGADRMPGLFLNTVPFVFGSTAATWRELVRDVFAQEVELWPHRRYPVLAMQRELAGGQRPIEVLFNYLDFHSVDTELVDFAASIDDSPNEFRLAATVFAQGLLTLRMHPAWISRRDGERLAAMYRLVLRAMAADPDGDARAAYLPAQERNLALGRELLAAVAEPPATLGALFEERAAAEPDAVAVVGADGGCVTYRELDRRANALAHELRGLGVGPEVLVGLCARPSLELLVGILAVAKAGGAYVPLDPAHPASRLVSLADEAGVVAVLAAADVRLPRLRQPLLPLDGTGGSAAPPPPDPIGPMGAAPPPSAGPDNPVYAMHTSGSTGRPKAVLVTHGALVNYLRWAARHYDVRDGVGAPALGSAAVDLSITNLLVPLIAGRGVTLLPTGAELDAVAGLLTEPAGFSLLKLTPSHLDALEARLEGAIHARAVRTLVVGGERLRADTVRRWRELAPHARIVNEYGPTETVVGCCAHEVLSVEEDAPIGRPIDGARMYVLDRNLQPAPLGVVGELYIGGAGLARGYLGAPGLTAQRFVPDPHAPTPGARCYRSGDLGRMRADGTFEFVGRIDLQVKIGGHRVEPAEVEAALRTHPDVDEAAVVARDGRLVAYLAGPPGIPELREFLARTLPAHLVPSAFVRLETLPRTPSGKVDRAALPPPGEERPDLGVAYVAPRNPIEQDLARIWARTLGVERVGVHDDLTDLGADSLRGLRVAAEVQELGFPMSPMDAIAYPTVAELAVHLLGGDPADLAAEIARDARLDPRIRPTAGPVPKQAVLVTGATGFVGSALLDELLRRGGRRVLCLVRAPSDEAGMRRLREALERRHLLDPPLTGRVEVVAGDLARPLLGLTAERFEELGAMVGEIYHLGAAVNALHPFRALRAPNVRGVQEVLRLACAGGLSHVHHASTLSIFTDGSSDDFPPEAPVAANGYAQSKWAGEALVREAGTRGVPTTVYRMGRVSWHGRTGGYNRHDLMTQILAASLRLGCAPDLPCHLTLTPVDQVAAGILTLAEAQPGQTHHLVGAHRTAWLDLVQWVRDAGHPLDTVGYRRWRERLEEQHRSFARLLTLLPINVDDITLDEGPVHGPLATAPPPGLHGFLRRLTS